MRIHRNRLIAASTGILATVALIVGFGTLTGATATPTASTLAVGDNPFTCPNGGTIAASATDASDWDLNCSAGTTTTTTVPAT